MHHFSFDYGDCNSNKVVLLTEDTLAKTTGTVCGNVDSVTANYICSSLGYGIAFDHGTASDRG